MVELPLLGHVHTKTGIFEATYFFYPDSCGRARLTPLESGFKTMRLRWADSLVSCERKVGSCFKVCGSKNIRMCKRSL